MIQREGDIYFVEIDSRHKGQGFSQGAILAHEVCHALLDDRAIPQRGSTEDEVKGTWR